jgi:hypothetical protein
MTVICGMIRKLRPRGMFAVQLFVIAPGCFFASGCQIAW